MRYSDNRSKLYDEWTQMIRSSYVRLRRFRIVFLWLMWLIVIGIMISVIPVIGKIYSSEYGLNLNTIDKQIGTNLLEQLTIPNK